MKYSERVVRNEIILNLWKSGLDQSEIARSENLCQQMVSKIVAKGVNGLPMSTKIKGVTRRLNDEELKQLPSFLEKGVTFYGFEGTYWTQARVGFVIKKEFNVDYGVKQVGRILALIKWTLQKPQKKNAKQSEAKVGKWKEEDLANLKKKAIEEDYEIYFQDESTLQLCNNIVKTYSPVGVTPILELQDTKGYQYVCIASAISEAGRMFYEIRDNSFKGNGIVSFLSNLLTFAGRKVLLIWDNASWHKSQEVKDFLNTDLGKMLWVANTPPYSPEFNPDELVWANLKKVQIPNRFAKNIKELKNIAHAGMLKIQNSVELIKSFFNKDNFYFTNS